jgi:cell wall-associated NlpC family hydrolase
VVGRVTMSGVNSRRYVSVPVAALWTSPTAPRDVDASAVATHPDVVAWLSDLDAAGARAGLLGRMQTQLEIGEPVDITGDPCSVVAGSTHGSVNERWVPVVAPLQPSRLDERGYPGWVPAAHVGALAPHHSPLAAAVDLLGAGASSEAFIALAREHLGLPYLWGGMCDWGLDCSGLVHLSLRRLGVVFPRDADDQYDECEHIPAADARSGDLFFFAHDGRRPHHVGIVTGPGRMVHAPQTGSAVIEEALTPARQDSLVGAGRLTSFLARTGLAG